jgi:hypothetical protein
MPSNAALSEPQDDTRVISVEWDKFLAWFRDVWEPGQHVALIGPTGEGKSTFAVGILGLRKYVLALDPKGHDHTLSCSGFERILSWPISNKMRDDIAEGRPCRLIVGGSLRTDRDQDRLVELMKQAVAGVRAEGGWTCYADEFQILADRRMFNIGTQVEQMLISARSRGTSVVTSFQAPAWVPKAATRQATFTVLWPTRDEDMVKAVATSMGRKWQEVAAAVKELPPYHVMVIPKRVHAPMVITTAPRIS